MNDESIIDAVLAGDRDAFSQLVARHQRWVTVVALRATGSLEEADELSQEVFLRAFRSLASWRREASFQSWLGRILTNLLRDGARARARAGRDLPLEAAPEPSRDAEQERRLLDRELLVELRRAYQALPPGRQRQVLRMRYVEGRPLADIADRLGLRVGTVKAHLFRAMARLRLLAKAGPRVV